MKTMKVKPKKAMKAMKAMKGKAKEKGSKVRIVHNPKGVGPKMVEYMSD